MASGASVEMLPDVAMGPATGGGGEELGRELGLLIREQRRRQEEAAAAAANRDNELSIFRSGSAPPSVEGSLNAVGGLFGENELASEEELRKDPAYLEYYYSHVNRNHRLPPPVLSKEDWRFTQRLQGGTSGFGGIGDARKGGDVGIGRRAVLDQQSGSNFQNEFSNDSRQAMGSGEWLNRQADVLIGLSDSSLRGRRQKSFKDAFQGNIGHLSSVPGRRSGPASTHSIADNGESLDSNVQTLLHPRAGLSSADGQSQRTNGNVQSVQSMASQTFASVLGTTTLRSRTPDPQLVARVPSPGLPPIGVKMNSSDKAVKSTIDSCDISSSGLAESVDLASTFQRMNISKSGHDDIGRYRKEMHVPENHIPESKRVQNIGKQDYSKKLESWHFDNSCLPQTTRSYAGVRNPNFVPPGKVDIQRSNISATNPYMEVPFTPPSISPVGSPVSYPLGYGEPSSLTYPGLSGYNLNPQLAMLGSQVGSASLLPQFQNLAAASMLSPGLGGFPAGSAPTELQTVNKLSDYATTNDIQMPLNPLYAQHLRNSLYAGDANLNANFAFIDRNYAGLSYSDLMEFQKAYERLIMQNTYNAPLWGKPGSLNQAYYSNSNLGLEVPYHINPLSCSGQFASGGPGSNFAHTDCNLRSPTLRSLSAERLGSWSLDNIGGIDDTYMSSLLEELKTSKTKSLELAEIAGHVVKFSADQFGSRFIQQKLETATAEEKNMVFEEIMPHALTLMTDVFGNYVVQKFFEHGTAAQTRELANQLIGHVLTLSLQMYGCRVIQKAIEVVDLDQQTKLVAELDGHVIRCVRDQNGNHVIQKCIECVPQEAIQFIISSFYDQVVALSMHSYGCRVIQRVLEHCDDPKTQEIVMSEIMPCVRILAEDQYGNYVIQHVLEHGKPEERSAIIKQFTGQIYLMSQQKFSSNVIEKCLAFGCPEERRALVNEMLGSTDENEPLQTMMKDPFGNYVVQKALETCDDQQRELILSRIKIHLNALKKYTYGKHIVARVEKLVAAGERRAAVQGQYSS